MARAKTSAETKFHNIIGISSNRSPFRSRREGDGIVDVDSARTPDAISELTIDAEHTTIHTTDRAIREVRRILLEHLQEIESNYRVAQVSGKN